MKLQVKRVYEKPAREDGTRILVDRLWPRGLTREKAGIDVWIKEIAPSTALRKWFGHDPDKWQEFKKRYRAELKDNKEQMAILKGYLKDGPVTLVYSAHDEKHNNAVALKELLSR